MGNSFGCSPSGERLVSAARDGDLQEAQALLDFNPRLAKYSTFGVRNSPLHFAASQGHNEIVALLLESGVDVNIRNYCGQTALMQACRYGHWEVVQTLILYKANVTRADYLNGRTALHFAAVNGHARCIRLLLADYLPSVADFWNEPSPSRSPEEGSSMKTYFDRSALARVVNRPADGGITALHMAALNGHVECVQFLLDLSADLSVMTIQDGTTIDLIGAGSTPLHYAACGGSTACCQVLISRGSSRFAQNSNGWTPLQVARLWHRQWLEPLLALDSQAPIPPFHSSRYLALPLMSIVKIARDCGWRNIDSCPTGADSCPVCLERKCTVASEGCGHELCTRCALYLCSTNSAATAVSGPPGSIPCPLCRHGIVAFVKLPAAPVVKELVKANMSLALCIACSTEVTEPMILSGPISRLDYGGSKISPLSSNAIRTVNCQGFSVTNVHFSTCNGISESERPVVRCNSSRSAQRADRTSWPTARSSIVGSCSESFPSLCLTAPVPKSSGPSQTEGRWWFHNLLSRSYTEN